MANKNNIKKHSSTQNSDGTDDLKLRFRISKKIAYFIFILVGLITISATYNTLKLKFSYNIESFFSKSDADYKFYKKYTNRFGGENNFVLVGIKNNQGIDNLTFFKKLNVLTHFLAKDTFVTKVISPTNINKKVITPLGLVISIPLIHFKDKNRLKNDLANLQQNKALNNSLFAKNNKSVLLFITKKAHASKTAEKAFLKKLKTALSYLKFDEYHLGGRINTQQFYIAEMQKEMTSFAILGIILLLLFLYFTFKNIWGIIIPLLVLIIAIIWTLGLMQITGRAMSLMMVMMPTMLFVIGVSDSVHIINKFKTEFKIHNNRKLAISITIKELGVAIFLTSFTTAIGFISLAFMDVEPLKIFGIYTAIGIMITYVVSILVIPSLLLVLKINFKESKKAKTCFLFCIENFYLTVTKHKKAFALGIVAVVLISINGLRYFKVNNNFLDDLDDKTALKQDMLFFEDNFAGIVPFEIAIEPQNNASVFDFKVLKETQIVANFLTKTYKAGLLISPTTVIKSANMTLNGGINSAFKLPKNKKKLKQILRNIKKWHIAKKYKSIVSTDEKHGRLSAKIKDLGSAKIGKLNQQLKTFIQNQHLQTKFIITGAAHLLNESNRKIAEGVVKGIFLAFFMIFLTIAILFNSIKTALISLLPNILPVLILGGLMGYFGIDLKVSSSLMFTIVLGIAVDDTIHILAKYRHQCMAGFSAGEALYTAFLSTGWSVVATSLIISSGFIIFIISNFESTFYTGLLVSISLLTALFSNLIMLPLLLGKSKDIRLRKKKKLEG